MAAKHLIVMALLMILGLTRNLQDNAPAASAISPTLQQKLDSVESPSYIEQVKAAIAEHQANQVTISVLYDV